VRVSSVRRPAAVVSLSLYPGAITVQQGGRVLLKASPSNVRRTEPCRCSMGRAMESRSTSIRTGTRFPRTSSATPDTRESVATAALGFAAAGAARYLFLAKFPELVAVAMNCAGLPCKDQGGPSHDAVDLPAQPMKHEPKAVAIILVEDGSS